MATGPPGVSRCPSPSLGPCFDNSSTVAQFALWKSVCCLDNGNESSNDEESRETINNAVELVEQRWRDINQKLSDRKNQITHWTNVRCIHTLDLYFEGRMINNSDIQIQPWNSVNILFPRSPEIWSNSQKLWINSRHVLLQKDFAYVFENLTTKLLYSVFMQCVFIHFVHSFHIFNNISFAQYAPLYATTKINSSMSPALFVTSLSSALFLSLSLSPLFSLSPCLSPTRPLLSLYFPSFSLPLPPLSIFCIPIPTLLNSNKLNCINIINLISSATRVVRSRNCWNREVIDAKRTSSFHVEASEGRERFKPDKRNEPNQGEVKAL